MSKPCLVVHRLTLALPKGADRVHAVEEVSFTIDPGEVLCIVGESGSGKSLTAHAIMGLLPPGVTIAGGQVSLGGVEVLNLPERERVSYRGRAVGMIFQEPMTSLNPLQTVGKAICEVFEVHTDIGSAERMRRCLALLEEVGLPDPPAIARAYPHQLSGGQRQRIMIAMALALEPDLLIADEPTTALDVTTQAQILKLIDALRVKRNMAVLFITHDFGVVAEIADRVAVMQLGRLVEIGPAQHVLREPQAPYSKRLLQAVPSLDVPDKAALGEAPIALEVVGLRKRYHTQGSFFHKARMVNAVDDVSFRLHRGEILGLVGESGSGKSTVGRCIVRLLQPDSGAVRLGQVDLLALNDRELRAHRNRIQMIFQDPFASLNPRRTIGRIISEGPMANGIAATAAMATAAECLDLVGLPRTALERYPHEFSGGQRQRIGIARALALSPDVIVADEPVSALDVSVQAQVLDLLSDLTQRLNLSLVFITHDLRVAAQLCHRIAVMQRGRLVEIADTRQLFAMPQETYTRGLLEAVPGRSWFNPAAAIDQVPSCCAPAP